MAWLTDRRIAELQADLDDTRTKLREAHAAVRTLTGNAVQAAERTATQARHLDALAAGLTGMDHVQRRLLDRLARAVQACARYRADLAVLDAALKQQARDHQTAAKPHPQLSEPGVSVS